MLNDRFTDLFQRSRKSSETINVRNLPEKKKPSQIFLPKEKGPKIFEVKVSPARSVFSSDAHWLKLITNISRD